MDCRILVVEDSEQIRENIYDFFAEKGGENFKIDLAPDGLKALDLVHSRDYDLAILDIMLPEVSGFDVCRAIRNRNDCPIIFLTALGTEDNILKGYELGGDEYMVKPFSLKVLYAKCLALLNRTNTGRQNRSISCGRITMNTTKMEVKVDGNTVDLQPREYFLLKALMENRESVLPRRTLLNLIWGDDFDGVDRVVDNQIKKLRKDLGSAGEQIRTVFGTGYKIVGD